MMQLLEAALHLSGCTIVGDPQTRFARVHTDSRSILPGDLFVALKGERFDAHDFLPEVAKAGAAAAIVAPGAVLPDGLCAIVVPDPKRALGELAAAWRKRFDIPLVMVVGSNGKTTTKEMIAAIFRTAVGEAAVLATQGNLNNDIGLPLTLLKLSAAHRLVVIEAGMNHPHETALLAAIAQPTVALITNAQREHQEFMESVQAVALEHSLAIHALPPQGVAVFPADDAFAGVWRKAAAVRRNIAFTTQSADAVFMSVLSQNGLESRMNIAFDSSEFEVVLRIGGAHNLHNAAAAIAAARAVGVELAAIAQGLNAFAPAKGRMRRLEHTAFTLIDDSYNANPDSVRAAIDVLAAMSGRRVLVLGDMGEVGAQSEAFHREVGTYAAQSGVDALITMGAATAQSALAYLAAAPQAASVHAATPTEAAGAVRSLQLTTADAVLVKGSRFMAMERVIEELQEKETATC
jgi:UDP-N-acetylmuramoyl-tripeptide--D-alanyl-D-alanine ligase